MMPRIVPRIAATPEASSYPEDAREAMHPLARPRFLALVFCVVFVATLSQCHGLAAVPGALALAAVSVTSLTSPSFLVEAGLAAVSRAFDTRN